MKKNLLIVSIILLSLALATYILLLIKKASNEVLESFGSINDKFEQISNDNALQLDSIHKVVMYSEYRDIFEQLDVLNQDFNYQIDNVKSYLLKDIPSSKKDSMMEDASIGDAYFFNSDGSYSDNGLEFVTYVANYKKEIQLLFRNQDVEIEQKVNKLFDHQISEDDWLNYHFKGFPLIVTLTKLTSMSLEIDSLKMKLLNELLKG